MVQYPERDVEVAPGDTAIRQPSAVSLSFHMREWHIVPTILKLIPWSAFEDAVYRFDTIPDVLIRVDVDVNPAVKTKRQQSISTDEPKESKRTKLW